MTVTPLDINNLT